MTDEQSQRASLLDKIDLVLNANSRWLWVLFGGAFLLKLVYIIQSAGDLRVTVPIMDSEYYYNMAVQIAAGHVVRPDAFFMGPLYPYVLAIIFSVFGKSIFIIRLIQSAAGALTVVLVYLLGKHRALRRADLF